MTAGQLIVSWARGQANHQISRLTQTSQLKHAPNMPTDSEIKQDKAASAAQARQVIDVFQEISTLLVSQSPSISQLAC